jgi:hypothetical protein
MRDLLKIIGVSLLATCVNFDTEARPQVGETVEDAVWQCYDYGIYTEEIALHILEVGLVTQSHIAHWTELEDFCFLAYELTDKGSINHYDK